jgi:hypothetical protein
MRTAQAGPLLRRGRIEPGISAVQSRAGQGRGNPTGTRGQVPGARTMYSQSQGTRLRQPGDEVLHREFLS